MLPWNSHDTRSIVIDDYHKDRWLAFLGMFLGFSALVSEDFLVTLAVYVIINIIYPERLLKATETGIKVYTRIFSWQFDRHDIRSGLPEITIRQSSDRYYHIYLLDKDDSIELDRIETLDEAIERLKEIYEKITEAYPLKIVKEVQSESIV
ncbi:MAG: hypothetical protein WBB45_20800 [Cyclobacteriaceae bacterium]